MLEPQTTADKPQGAAASLLNGLTVLEAFSVAKRSLLGVTEISELVGLHKSTVSRMLTGLDEAGYVQRDEDTGRYRLGLGMIGLAGPLLAELGVRRAALPHLEELTEATGETAAIAVWNGTNAIVVEQTASPHQVKHSAAIGTRYNKFASSSVRVFLAELPPEETDRLLAGRTVLRDGYRGLETRPTNNSPRSGTTASPSTTARPRTRNTASPHPCGTTGAQSSAASQPARPGPECSTSRVSPSCAKPCYRPLSACRPGWAAGRGKQIQCADRRYGSPGEANPAMASSSQCAVKSATDARGRIRQVCEPFPRRSARAGPTARA